MSASCSWESGWNAPNAHQPPFESYSQKDFYSFAAYFAKLGRKGTGLSPPISGSEEFLFTAARKDRCSTLSGEVLQPAPLFGTAAAVTEGTDPRVILAEWVTSRENPFFGQTMPIACGRADLMGRGLVEPVDDLRATNPASNPALLEALGKDFAASGYNIKHLIRQITTSSVYGLSSIPNERNVADTRNFFAALPAADAAEVLLDSVSQICRQPENFEAMPPGALSKEIWTHRSIPCRWTRLAARTRIRTLPARELSTQPSYRPCIDELKTRCRAKS